MTGTVFHKPSQTFTVAELAKKLGAVVEGDDQKELTGVKPLGSARAGDLSFFSNSKYKGQLEKTKASAVLVDSQTKALVPAGVSALIVDIPYAAFAKALQLFFRSFSDGDGISEMAHIHPTAEVAKGCSVAPGTVIAKSAKIGKGTLIGPNSYIGPHVTVGEDCRIGASVSIICTTLGDRVIVHHGCGIGQDGFGFAHDGQTVLKVPQVGAVRIGHDVEIGANTTIDRGALEDTVIGDFCKLDNLVQIGHNVKLGKGCQIVAQTGIAGSTELGNGVIVGGQTAIAGHLHIASNTQIAGRSGVTKPITEAGQKVGGFPAQPLAQWRRTQAAIARLAKGKTRGK